LAYVVELNLRAMIIRTGVTAFLGLVTAALAEDRFQHHDWHWFGYSSAASTVLFFLCICSICTIARATSSNH
jgi:hypothetical protein